MTWPENIIPGTWPKVSGVICTVVDLLKLLVEAAGIEPASESLPLQASTCVFRVLILARSSPHGHGLDRASGSVFSPRGTFRFPVQLAR